jgi:hypothetical protein
MSLPDLTDRTDHSFVSPEADVQVGVRPAREIDPNSFSERTYREARELWFRRWLATHTSPPCDALTLPVEIASQSTALLEPVPGTSLVMLDARPGAQQAVDETGGCWFHAELWLVPDATPVEAVVTGSWTMQTDWSRLLSWPLLRPLVPGSAGAEDLFRSLARILAGGRLVSPDQVLPGVGCAFRNIEMPHLFPLTRTNGFRYTSRGGTITYYLEDAPPALAVRAPDGHRVLCREALPAGRSIPRRTARPYRDGDGQPVPFGTSRIERTLSSPERQFPVRLTVTSEDPARNPAALAGAFLTALETALREVDHPG